MWINDKLYLVTQRPSDRDYVAKLLIEERKNGKTCFVAFTHEWETRQAQILSHINSYDSTEMKVVFARKCEVKEISLKEVRTFCDKYHIQGANRLAIAGWGIYEGQELFGVLSLGRHSRQSEDTLLDRLCFQAKTRVVGGSSKLFSAAIKWATENNIKRIVSFSDNRWSVGRVYEQLGFQLDSILAPDYFYVSKDDFTEYHSKQSQKKGTVNCPEGMTEKEWADARGLCQVYDAGKKRWVYKIALERKIKNPLAYRRQGYYETKKSGVIYYQSSYELRAATLLDEMNNVVSYRNQVRFIIGGQERYIDFFVTYSDGRFGIIEVKPLRKVEGAKEQINDNRSYATKQGWEFALWTESELGFKTEHYGTVWADKFLTEIKGVDFVAERKLRNNQKSKTFYQNNIATNKVEVHCEFCNVIHNALRLTYEKNITRNGRYICEREGGSIAGKLPKKKKENPLAAEGKKACMGPCGLAKSLEDFGNDKSRSDGKSTKCKACRAVAASNKYHEKKIEKSLTTSFE